MKNECDKNGLEYEILMQESAKERFLRQVGSYSNPFTDLAKNFVILKHKREPSPTPDNVFSASDNNNIADSIVAASNPIENADDGHVLGMPLKGKAGANAIKAAIADAQKFGFKKGAFKAAEIDAARTSFAGALAFSGLGGGKKLFPFMKSADEREHKSEENTTPEWMKWAPKLAASNPNESFKEKAANFLSKFSPAPEPASNSFLPVQPVHLFD